MENRRPPRELGYVMPAEWEPHEATWLAWPHNPETWPGLMDQVTGIWGEMIRSLSRSEKVRLLVNDENEETEVKKRLGAAGAAMENVLIYRIPTVDAWIRDYGPTFLTRRGPEPGLALTNWRFNAWGGKYQSHCEDGEVGRAIGKIFSWPVFSADFVLEGGSIEVNGSGVCLTTEQCLLNPNRNPNLSRTEVERRLRDFLAVDQVIWLDRGMVGDDTDGHIDNLARFVNPNTIVCSVEQDEGDDNYAPLRENFDRLKAARNRSGQGFTVVPIPVPGKVVYDGGRLPASYVNFYIANGVVLVPTFEDPNDSAALGLLQDLFPGRKIVGLPSRSLVVGLGGVHCVTQQEPAP